MTKEIHFSARCPFCEKPHHHYELLAGFEGVLKPVRTLTHHFTCCGHEVGFSVRRLLLGDRMAEANAAMIAAEPGLLAALVDRAKQFTAKAEGSAS